jgi:hypothetical protein
MFTARASHSNDELNRVFTVVIKFSDVFKIREEHVSESPENRFTDAFTIFKLLTRGLSMNDPDRVSLFLIMSDSSVQPVR